MAFKFSHCPAPGEVRTVCQIAPETDGDRHELAWFLERGLELAGKEFYIGYDPVDIKELIKNLRNPKECVSCQSQ